MDNSDRRFHGVVIESSSYSTMSGWGHKACCSSCGTYHECDWEEFNTPLLVSTEDLKYISEMRAWNCCHEAQEPVDGFPERPENIPSGVESVK